MAKTVVEGYEFKGAAMHNASTCVSGEGRDKGRVEIGVCEGGNTWGGGSLWMRGGCRGCHRVNGEGVCRSVKIRTRCFGMRDEVSSRSRCIVISIVSIRLGNSFSMEKRASLMDRKVRVR